MNGKMQHDNSGAADVRYLVGGWSHIFSEREGSRNCRLVFDCEDNKVVALQIANSVRGWLDARPIEMEDVQDSLLNANEEALQQPEQWGLALTARQRQAARPVSDNYLGRSTGVVVAG